MIWESLKMAWLALTANLLRAILTMLGVFIGITFVLLMGWALSGLDGALEKTLSIFGDDLLYVDKFSWSDNSNWQAARNRKNITYDQFLKMKQRIRSAEYIVPTTRTFGAEVRYQDQILSNAIIFGSSFEYIFTLGGSVAEGRFFTENEDNGGGLVCIIGSEVVESLFPDKNAVGRTLKIQGIPFVVIGVMPKRGTALADFADRQLIIPIKRFFMLFGSTGMMSRVIINVKAGGTQNIDNVRYETIGVMRQVRSLSPGMDDDFAVNTQEQFRQQTDQLRVIVWSVGIVMTGLSFLVGSIGIMNIMFVSVTERTREIGIRKAVGAKRSGILFQFLIEAIMLCLIGALIGFIFTSAVAYILSTTLDSEFLNPTVPVSQFGIALLVSVIVGVLAGIIPAFRAARMNPVDALRAE